MTNSDVIRILRRHGLPREVVPDPKATGWLAWGWGGRYIRRGIEVLGFLIRKEVIRCAKLAAE